MHWTQFGGMILGVAAAGIVREVVRPAYQKWVVKKVQSGQWTMLEAQRFDHRVDMAIWLPAAFATGFGVALAMSLVS